MAKAYRVRRDVSFPRVLSRAGEGDSYVEAVEGMNYPAGSIVRHDSLTKYDQGRAESGDLDHLLVPMDDEEAKATEGYGDVEPEYGIFVPEHEAEAHALLVAGHTVVPKDQVMEALSSGEAHSAEYQRAVADAGGDRRPVQEYLAETGKERVPDEFLQGAETPAGTPHNRGPVQEEDDRSEEGEADNNSEEGEQTAARPRPQLGSEAQSQGSQGD